MKKILSIFLLALSILFLQCKSEVRKETDLNANSDEKITIPDIPSWLHNAVFYEIYPQSFYDSNGDGIGDIPGVTQKLDYVKSLGVSCIWMNPVFVSPFRDAGYDVADYYHVAPRYGTNDDIKRLFAEAHKRNMHIIIDCIFGHTSIDHPWFKESCRPDSNKYTNRYIWTNSTWKKFDMCGQVDGTVINGYCNRDGNFLTNYFWAQPALNFGYAQPDPSKPWELSIDHPSVMELREEMKNFLRFWLNMGCDGFHMDMASSLVKRDTINKVAEIWKDVRSMLNKDYPQAFIIPEWCVPSNSIPAGFHADFLHWIPEYWDLFQAESWRCLNGSSDKASYFDTSGKGDLTRFMDVYLKYYAATKDKGYLSYVLSNLNLARNSIKRSNKDMEIIYAFVLTMPGLPFIWYGEELGMRQLPKTVSKEGAYWPRSGARTPMQWNKSANLGFSKGKADQLYFPVDPAADAPNVEEEEKDSASCLNSFKRLMKIRNSQEAFLNYANLKIFYLKKNESPFIYGRYTDKEKIVVIINPANQSREVELNTSWDLTNAQLLIGDLQEISKKENSIIIKTKPNSYSILKLK